MKVITWNTGCLYTVHGQRMAAARVDGGIVFVDVDRQIDGFIRDDEGIERALASCMVMQAYLHNRYTHWSVACPTRSDAEFEAIAALVAQLYRRAREASAGMAQARVAGGVR